MAGAMLSRWLTTGLDAARVTVIDPALPETGTRCVATLPIEPAPDMVVLGIKPQLLGDVAPMLRPATSGALLLSILAGTRLETLEAIFRDARGIVRVMPNLPVAIGKGAVALHARADAADRAAAAALMQPLGLVEWIDDEPLFDIVTALSGSGPAFVYRFIGALADGAIALGLPADQAMRLARATVEGAAAVAASSADDPSMLADRVASKGGSTRAGLDVFDNDAAFTQLVAAALGAATRRNEALAALSAGG
jgi:pyrroline-5-carboxylate reductase